ncbi:MAG: methyltransferase domain-containing protein [Actinobacteria bacterium]|nr:methyltransferase domain-containing protein [Actinomycetota bacterium]
MTTSQETFQLSLQAAELYEADFVPALFAEWAPHLVDMAEIGAGDAVLDVACGTGIVARTAADRVGTTGRVLGLDLNEAMLAVARRVRPDLDWRHGDAGSLPFPDRSFDAVTCSFGLMFFPDWAAALREMSRVAAADGTVALVVPASLSDQPAYGPFVEAAARHAGPDAVSLLGAYWSCGDLDELRALLADAALQVVGSRTRTGTVRFRSAGDFVATEVDSTPLRQRISDQVYDRIAADAHTVLAPYTTSTGSVEAPIVCHVVAARPTPA